MCLASRSFLEAGMFERFLVINRFDPVTSAPLADQGYRHWRPAVWWIQHRADGISAQAQSPLTCLSLSLVQAPS